MLLLFDTKYWEKPRKILEPCCGKGNFVLAIFDLLYNGLQNMYPDEYIRCKIIINKCLYYGDISLFNVFITTELLKCHIQSYCAIDDFSEFNFQTYSGDLLDDTKNEIDYNNWKDFDAIIGNPPYDQGKNHNFYIKFIDKSYEFLKPEGILLFVIPNRFLIPKHSANNCLNNKFQFLNITHTTNEFNVSTDIGYFMALKNDKDKIDNTHVRTVFKNDEIYYIDLNIPTPTKTNDYNYKKLSDKIIINHLSKLNFIKANDYIKQKEEEKNPAIFIKRQWKRFSPKREKGGTHIFQIIEDYENELDMQKPDGSFLEITESTKNNIIWYLSRSKIIRFITAIYASNMNVPPFIWESIPKIDFSRSYTDNELFDLFNITADEIELIDKIID
jgi:SAM-dependent methyltransferase